MVIRRRMATDLQLELFWDQNAQWFGMRSYKKIQGKQAVSRCLLF